MEINFALLILYAAVLITASVIDMRHLYVPDRIHLCILALALCAYGMGETCGLSEVFGRIFGFAGAAETVNFVEMIFPFLSCLIPAGILLLVSLLTRGGIGGGDIKLIAASGLLLGFKKTFLAVLLTYLLAGMLHLVPLLTGKLDRKAEIPMVPYFTVALLLSAAFGNRIISVYFLFLGISIS